MLASGWNSGMSGLVEVGQLTVNVHRRTVSFSPTGPWQNEPLAGPFSDRPLGVLDSDGMWTRWLLELGANALAGSRTLLKAV